MRMLPLLIASCIIVLASHPAGAAESQAASVRVEVAASGKPLPGATVSAGGASATTDASGVATLTVSGQTLITASKDGYRPAAAKVDAAAGPQQSARLVLTAVDAALAFTPRVNAVAGDQAVPIEMLDRAHIATGMLRSPGDVRQMFNGMPGVRVQTTSPVLGTSVLRIDGLPGRYTRLLFDGVHLFSDRPGGYGLLRVPPMDLDQIEILRGPAGAFFGSDSPAGSLNLISRKEGARPERDILFSQSSRGSTDGAVWISTPATGPSRSWSSTFLASAHRQEEKDVNGDGWSDIPRYARGVLRPRVTWTNRRGKTIAGVADVTFEKREGGTAGAREAVETKTADGYMSGQIIRSNGMVLAGAGALFIQSRTRDWSDARERDRLQTATIEITLSRREARHHWLGGIASDWYGLRSIDNLPSTYISTRPGMFFHDDFFAAPWLVMSGSVRLDHHNIYGLLASPRGSLLVRNGSISARFTAAQGYFTPRLLSEETEAAGLARLKLVGPAQSLEKETARSVSGDVAYRSTHAAVSFRIFRNQIDDPALVDRATYTLRTDPDPIVTRGVEISGTARQSLFSVTGAFAHVRTRGQGALELPLTPQNSGTIIAAADSTRGRISVEAMFVGKQRLVANPYRTTSEAYTLVGVLAEAKFGRWRAFVNADNLRNVRQTRWNPIARPARDVDGRWTVDAWAPLAGRVVNAGVRILY